MRKLITIVLILMTGLFMMATGQTNRPKSQKEDTVKKKTVTVTKDKDGKETVEKEKEVNRKRVHRKNINEDKK